MSINQLLYKFIHKQIDVLYKCNAMNVPRKKSGTCMCVKNHFWFFQQIKEIGASFSGKSTATKKTKQMLFIIDKNTELIHTYESIYNNQNKSTI